MTSRKDCPVHDASATSNEPLRQLLDKACDESFFKTLRGECVYHLPHACRDEAKQASPLSHSFPAEFEARGGLLLTRMCRKV
jgi:hypothetical protein